MAEQPSASREWPVCVTIITHKRSSVVDTTVVKNRIARFPKRATFIDFFQDFTARINASNDVQHRDRLAVCVSTLTGESFEVEENETLETVLEFGNVKYVKYKIDLLEESEVEVPNPPRQNAFEIIMGSQGPGYKQLQPIAETNKKHALHNAVLVDIQENGPILRRSASQEDGHKIVQKVTDAIWYLDGRQKAIQDAVKGRGSHITPLPIRFEKYVDYQDWKSWRKKPRIEQERCKEFAASLLCAVEKQAIKLPEEWTEDIIAAASTFSTYAKYLQEANKNQQQRQSQLYPVRQLSNSATGQYWPPVPSDKVHKHLVKLSSVMTQEDEYNPVLVSDEHFNVELDASQKYYLMSNIALAVPVQALRYDPGGGSFVIHFLYRVPLHMSDNERLTVAIRTLKQVESQIPVFHTRAMRKAFQRQLSNLNKVDIEPHVLRHIYCSLTGDNSALTECAQIDERVKLAIETEDVDLVLDLRHLNKGRPGDTFNIFFQELEKLVDEITAADDRRHGAAHMSTFLSIRDLIQQVKLRIPESCPVPSEATVTYAFAPPNTHSRSAQYYVGRVNLKHAVQRRQLRAYHTDAHWCNALFKYMREMAVLHHNNSIFLSCDDKAKVDFGEPGHALSTGVRGKKSIIPTTSFLGALDHDVNQKGSLTPSVTLMCDIPDDVTDSFYRGQVSVCLKDSVFQPSNSFRTVQEMLDTLKYGCEEGKLDTVKNLFIMTDGGPEHRVNFDSVKIPLILLFRELNLDRLIAIRTAPGYSYVNLVERVMSILNIGFQNVALQRESSPSDETIKKCQNLEALRRHHLEIKDDWNQSILPLVTILEERVNRLSLKETPFLVMKPVTDSEYDEFVEKSAQIDVNLPAMQKAGKLTKANLASKASYQQFLNDHCRQGHYVFQVRKCDDSNCCGEKSVEQLHWLPYPMEDPSNPGHYKKFDDLYGEDTSEDHIPSILNDIRKVSVEQQGCTSKVLVGQNVREIVKCSECRKPRCIYSPRQLTAREQRELHTIIRKYNYTCGCIITPDGSVLVGQVFARLELACTSPVEWAYYCATKISCQKDVCAHCGQTGATKDEELARGYRTVLPLCGECKGMGKESLKRGPLPSSTSTNPAKRAKNK